MNPVRRLVEIIGRYWSENLGPRLNDIGSIGAEPLSDKERLWNKMVRANGCTECDTRPKFFAEGPSGGMCTNVFCTHCGQGYNITPVAQWAEMIHKDERYIVREKENQRG